MSRASVPIAAVNEDSNASAREDQVGGAVEMRQRSGGHPVSQAKPVCRASNSQLGPRIALSVALHYEPNGRR
jgi:hypothetical protein